MAIDGNVRLLRIAGSGRLSFNTTWYLSGVSTESIVEMELA